MQQTQKQTDKVEITLNEEVGSLLECFAAKEGRPVAEIASTLFNNLLEEIEDRYFIELADAAMREDNEIISEAELMRRLNITEDDLK